jgi:hypothetical protein
VTAEQIVASIFATGDQITVPVNNSTSKKTVASIVNNTASLSIKGVSGVYIPFSSSIVTTQTVNLIDSTNAVIPVVYGTNKITVGGIDRAIGSKFMIDGRIATVSSN